MARLYCNSCSARFNTEWERIDHEKLHLAPRNSNSYHVVFDSFPSPNGARFVELEDDQGRSISGAWRSRPDGNCELVLPISLIDLDNDDRFAHEFKKARENGNMYALDCVLSGRLRAMDKRARAANKRADAVEAALAALEAGRDMLRKEVASLADSLDGSEHCRKEAEASLAEMQRERDEAIVRRIDLENAVATRDAALEERDGALASLAKCQREKEGLRVVDDATVTRAHKAQMSELFLLCQPNRGDVFSFMDDHKDVMKVAIQAALNSEGA